MNYLKREVDGTEYYQHIPKAGDTGELVALLVCSAALLVLMWVGLHYGWLPQ